MLRNPYVDVPIDPEGPPLALALLSLLALFGRCLVLGTIVSVAAWMLVSATLDRFG
jgi:hypothetical protein